MNRDDNLERLIASLANRDPVDWDEAGRAANTDSEVARIAALRGVAQIAAFTHASWQRFQTLLEHTRGKDPPTLEHWLGGLDFIDSADLRALLNHQQVSGARGPAAAAGGPTEITPHADMIVGAYALETLIGEGGMGEVWRARRSDGRFEARVAIKMLHLPLVSRHGQGRFLREGQILARLRHPNIAQLIDAGVTPAGQPYLVLEHVDGTSIDRHCDAHHLDLRARIKLFIGVLAAVAHAQTNLVLHRDLKPGNILVDRAGDVKLLDFGVAKLLTDEAESASDSEVTQHVGRAFTPEFAAPEQLRGSQVTTASDVYSAGVVLFRLLTGRHPIAVGQGTPLERMRTIIESVPRLASSTVLEPLHGGAGPTAVPPARDARELRRRQRQLKGDLDNVLAKALKTVPEERYPGAAAFADDLQRYLAGRPVLARADTIGYRVAKFVRRHRASVMGALSLVIVLAGMTAVTLSQRNEARRQRDEAREQSKRADAFTGVVTSLLSQSGPGGRALTPEELLDRAVENMVARYADDPAFEVGMLIRISGRYYDLQNTNKELATLVRAEEIARRSADPALLFDVQVNTVETELAAGHKREARERIEEARRLLPTLKNQPDLEDYWRAEAKVARANNDLATAIAYLNRARSLLETSGRIHGNSYPGILSEIATSQYMAGDLRAAYQTTLRTVELDRQHGREQSTPGVLTRGTLAGEMYMLGEVQRARAMLEELVPGIGQPGTETSPFMSQRYGEILSRLGEHGRGLRLIQGAIEPLTASGNQVLLVRTRLSLARALVRAGRPGDARVALDDAVNEMLSDTLANRVWLAEASRVRTEAWLADHRAEEAVRAAEYALRQHGYPARRHGLGLPAALLTGARVEVVRGRFMQASQMARSAIELFEMDALDPGRSADVGEALLVLAEAQHENDDAAGARASLSRATKCLRQGLGPTHALTRRAEALARRW